jgi:hypothetical protein
VVARSITELAEGVRSFVIGNYVAFYIPMANGIQLLRVPHSARDAPRTANVLDFRMLRGFQVASCWSFWVFACRAATTVGSTRRPWAET